MFELSFCMMGAENRRLGGCSGIPADPRFCVYRHPALIDEQQANDTARIGVPAMTPYVMSRA